MEELFGCWREADRADQVATVLTHVREELSPESFEVISAILNGVEQTSRQLRDLHDLFPIYRTRVQIVIYYLTVILPCLCKTLRDMKAYLECEDFTIKARWDLMYERLNDQGGMTLANRFVMSPLYDPTILESLRMRILQLRLLRNIPAPPVPVQPHLAPVQPNLIEIERRHWAEKIFDDQPLSQSLLRHRRDSKCLGPSMVEPRLGIPPQPKVLFKIPFDKNRFSVTACLDDSGVDSPRYLCRWIDKLNLPHYSAYGVHELCVTRRGSALIFKRWSEIKQSPTVWIALNFKTWQRMVLFHCTFVALKARSLLTSLVSPEDYRIEGERRIFQGQILDDDFQHSLYVFQDTTTNTIRLHAAVAEGDLRKCPVWTAFVTELQEHSDTWLARHSRHRVWVKDLHIYVFCDEYRRKTQIRRHGEFELNFAHSVAADAFVALFQPDESDGEHAIEDVSSPASPPMAQIQ